LIVILPCYRFTFECRLECDTTNPLIEWFKDGAAMTHGTTDYKDGLCRLTLDIVGPNDSATYTCKATTSAGSAETTATVKVKGKPATGALIQACP